MKIAAPTATALCLLLLAACAPAPTPAPISEIRIDRDKPLDTTLVRPDRHLIEPGENLIEIATSYGLSYKDVARWNNLSNPNLIKPGQHLVLTPPKYEASATPVAKGAKAASARPVLRRAIPAKAPPPDAIATPKDPKQKNAGVRRQQIVTGTPRLADTAVLVAEPKALKVPFSEQEKKRMLDLGQDGAKRASLRTGGAAKPPGASRKTRGINWSWPAKGKVTNEFGGDNRGLDIGGKRGAPVHASADGQVIYVGSGVKGFGQIVIVRHKDEYVSLYAHNDKIFVAEGDKVGRGDTVAAMGDTGTDKVVLHFQIRRGSKVFDPRQFLPKSGG